MLYLRTQTEVLAQVRAALRDGAAARWTDAEIYGAMNEALLSWHNRVAPVVYETIDVAMGTHGYQLPVTVRPPFRVQVGNVSPAQAVQLQADAIVWSDVIGYTAERGPDEWLVRWSMSPPNALARIAYLLDIGPAPTVVPALSGALTINDDSLVHTGVLPVGESGVIRIDQEWIQYGTRQTGATTTTLAHLVRGINNTQAASHLSAANVVYGIPATSPELYGCLLDHMRALLHEVYLTNAAPAEQQKHQQMTSFYRQLVAQFWTRWRDPAGASAFSGRIIPGRIVGIG